MTLEILFSAIVTQVSQTEAPADVLNYVTYCVLESRTVKESEEERLNVIAVDLLLIFEVMRKNMLLGLNKIKLLLVYRDLTSIHFLSLRAALLILICLISINLYLFSLSCLCLMLNIFVFSNVIYLSNDF